MAYRPQWIEDFAHSYNRRGKHTILVTGSVLDLFWNEQQAKHLPLEQSLYQEYYKKFTLVRYDTASGITFFDDKDKDEICKQCGIWDRVASNGERLGDIRSLLSRTRHEPLPALLLLSNIAKAITKLRRTKETETKPLLMIIQYAGSLFPNKELDQLSEIDRQRLVQMMSWLQDPITARGDNGVLLIADSRSEVHSKILALPSSDTIEIDLPGDNERKRFAEEFAKSNDKVTFETGINNFVEDSAGLPLTAIEDVLEVAARSGSPVDTESILTEVNRRLEKDLNGIVKVVKPAHTTKDVIGFEIAKKYLKKTFKRCEDPELAIPSLLVVGPNGGGKTFTLEALANESGRIVIELTGLRGMYFGQTDRFFERLLWHIKTYGKILILVDEADTAFGSMEGKDSHETEKRLTGNVIKMMGDPKLFGKVLWALMTARPDQLSPDMKSRCPVQIPIFDLDLEERKVFITELFKRKEIILEDENLKEIAEQTSYYSLRDYRFLIGEVLSSDDPSDVLATLKYWRAGTSIVKKRKLQTLKAAQHCSYPELLPDELKEKTADELDLLVLAEEVATHLSLPS